MTPLRLRAAFAVLALTAAGLVNGTVAATQSKAVVDTNNYIARAADAAKWRRRCARLPINYLLKDTNQSVANAGIRKPSRGCLLATEAHPLFDDDSRIALYIGIGQAF